MDFKVSSNPKPLSVKPGRSCSCWESVTLELKQVMEHVGIFPAFLVYCGCVPFAAPAARSPR